MGPTCCPETSVNNTLRNIPEKRTSHLYCGRSLKPGHYKLMYIDKYLLKTKVNLLAFFKKFYAPNECTEYGTNMT